MAMRLKQRGGDIWRHWERLVSKLERQFGIRVPAGPSGYSITCAVYWAGGVLTMHL